MANYDTLRRLSDEFRQKANEADSKSKNCRDIANEIDEFIYDLQEQGHTGGSHGSVTNNN